MYSGFENSNFLTKNLLQKRGDFFSPFFLYICKIIKIVKMKKYTKTHSNKKAHDNHLKKILSNGGQVISDNGKTIEYGFPKTLINKKYTHFAVRKSNNTIVTGWEYSGIDSEELNSEKNHYFNNDLKDLDLNPKDFAIYTKAKMLKLNINPFDTNNWKL